MKAAGRAAVRPALLRDPGHFLALGGGSGLVPRAPGTCGTLAALPLYWLLESLAPLPYLVVVVLLFVGGAWLCGRTATALGEHDHGAIVFDEMVGYLIAVSFCSSGAWGLTVAFCAFRLFDILKPWPVGWLDLHIGGGAGIMVDDVVAALYALAVVELFEYFSFGYTMFR